MYIYRRANGIYINIKIYFPKSCNLHVWTVCPCYYYMEGNLVATARLSSESNITGLHGPGETPYLNWDTQDALFRDLWSRYLGPYLISKMTLRQFEFAVWAPYPFLDPLWDPWRLPNGHIYPWFSSLGMFLFRSMEASVEHRLQRGLIQFSYRSITDKLES